MNWRTFTAVALVLTSVVLAPGNHAAFGQANWDGSDSADYFTAGNWDTNAVPVAAQAVNVGSIAFTNAPVYNGDNTTAPAGDVIIGSTNSATFTMDGGTFQTANVRVGNVSGTSGGLTVNNGVINTVSGQFRSSPTVGSSAVIVMTGGEINVNAPLSGNEVLFAADGALGGNAPFTTTTITMSGDTTLFTSSGRIRFGRSNSDSTTNDNATVLVNMSDGLMWAKGVDGAGTINFQGGKINLSGGILRAGDLSSASGFNRNVANGKQGGVDFTGGVVEVETDLVEGAIYEVPPGGDLLTTLPKPLQRGQSRALGYARDLSIERFYTTLADHLVQVKVEQKPTDRDVARVFASVLGDYNLNGEVDAADYTLWRDTLGYSYYDDNLDPTSVVPYWKADGDGSGTIDDGDRLVWMANFGKTTIGGPYGAGAGASTGFASAPVPEPASALMVLVGAAVAGVGCSRRRTKLS